MTRPGRQQGFAIVAVVWAIALLSVMALDVLAAARREAGNADASINRAQLGAAADAGVMLAAHALLANARELPDFVEFAGVSLGITVEDEAGKLDLNAASPRLLRQLLEAVEVPSARAEALVAALEDWRDQDQITRPRGGAEIADYRRAGRPPPRDGVFHAVEELVEVAGFTPELVGRLAPALTVYTRAQQPDRARAVPLVRTALGGGGATGQPALELRPPAAIGRVVTVRVLARRGGAQLERTAVVRVTGNPREPLLVQGWW